MAKDRGAEFRKEAVRLAQNSGLTRKQLSADLGVGLSTHNRWVSEERNTELLSGPHDDLEKENARLRKEVKLLREETQTLKRPPSSL
jgi:transposase